MMSHHIIFDSFCLTEAVHVESQLSALRGNSFLVFSFFHAGGGRRVEEGTDGS